MELTRICSARSVKRRLMEYRDGERYLETQAARLERLVEKMYGTKIPELSDMPKAQSTVMDRTGLMVAQKLEIEEEIRSVKEKQRVEREWIKGVLRHLKSAEEVAVIQTRYLDAESWNTVAKVVFGQKPDFDEKQESYLRQSTKLHKRALSKIADYISREMSDAWSI